MSNTPSSTRNIPLFSRDEEISVAQTFDLKDMPEGFLDNPYPFYRALRKHDPVHRMPDGGYILTRYRDCAVVYRDHRTFASDKKKEFGPKYGVESPLYEHHTGSLVFNDPPLHTRVRKIIAGALTPKAIAAMQPALEALIDRLLDEAEARGAIDLIEDFAAAIPIEVIGNLLAVPHQDRSPLRGWSLAILGALEPTLTDEQMARGNRAVTEFKEYLRGLVRERRKNPGDPASDVLTRLVEGEGADAKLSETELLQNCIFILNAGHETTTNLIGNGLNTLLEWPEEKQRLIDNPSLIKPAVEEFLRIESSNQLGNRISVRATQVGDVKMDPDTRITICIGAANRDPDEFPDPDRLDIGRHPNRHLAFATGVHACAGMSLARLEGEIAMGKLLARFPNYQLVGEPVRGGRARFRGFLSLPATLG